MNEKKTTEERIIRVVTVDRLRTPVLAIAATTRAQHLDYNVVSTMPRGYGENVRVEFFPVERRDGGLQPQREYELRNMLPADPYSLCAGNEADPVFADDHPNVTFWKDAYGKSCMALFYRFRAGEQDRRVVVICQQVDVVLDCLWFAGFAK
jgi:hypothetical protein